MEKLPKIAASLKAQSTLHILAQLATRWVVLRRSDLFLTANYSGAELIWTEHYGGGLAKPSARRILENLQCFLDSNSTLTTRMTHIQRTRHRTSAASGSTAPCTTILAILAFGRLSGNANPPPGGDPTKGPRMTHILRTLATAFLTIRQLGVSLLLSWMGQRRAFLNFGTLTPTALSTEIKFELLGEARDVNLCLERYSAATDQHPVSLCRVFRPKTPED